MIVTRDAVKEVLRKWQDGTMETSKVQAWASDRYASKDHTFADWEEDKSIINEILVCLDSLALNAITKDDVPVLLELLDTPKGSFDEGIFTWENHLLSLDLDQRKKDVKADKQSS